MKVEKLALKKVGYLVVSTAEMLDEMKGKQMVG